ncbi:hypothetical protein Scep_009750 [Stephania cephalantha]|uniref:Uncharacterized protein n=1 Tax=Stephania cephalantha TaxID=152367 RepID=A0AAP0JUF3_9MAGN
MPSQNDNENGNADDLGEAYQQNESFSFKGSISIFIDLNEQNNWIRANLDPMVIETSARERKRKGGVKRV